MQRNLVTRTVLGAAALVAVCIVGFVIVSSPAHSTFDLGVDQWLSAHHEARLVAIATAVHWLLDPLQAILLTLVAVVAIALRTRDLRRAIGFGAVVAVSWVPSDLLKLAVDRARPAASSLAHPFTPAQLDPSYPSGHVVFAASLAIAAFLLLRTGDPRRPVVAVIGAVLVAVVAGSVLVIGIHFPSDVIASMVWALGATTLIRVAYLRLVGPWLDSRFDEITKGLASVDDELES